MTASVSYAESSGALLPRCAHCRHGVYSHPCVVHDVRCHSCQGSWRDHLDGAGRCKVYQPLVRTPPCTAVDCFCPGYRPSEVLP